VPTYSYACTACEHRFDTVQSFTDPSLTDCPECSGRLRKLFSAVGIVFKGSGFYRTDSRATGSDKPTSNGKSENGKSENGKSENGKSKSGAEDKSSAKKPEAKSSDSKTSTASSSATS
jgi:putative FmdB family regulatory protein